MIKDDEDNAPVGFRLPASPCDCRRYRPEEFYKRALLPLYLKSTGPVASASSSLAAAQYVLGAARKRAESFGPNKAVRRLRPANPENHRL
jgi:hypothetical protein